MDARAQKDHLGEAKEYTKEGWWPGRLFGFHNQGAWDYNEFEKKGQNNAKKRGKPMGKLLKEHVITERIIGVD